MTGRWGVAVRWGRAKGEIELIHPDTGEVAAVDLADLPRGVEWTSKTVGCTRPPGGDSTTVLDVRGWVLGRLPARRLRDPSSKPDKPERTRP